MGDAGRGDQSVSSSVNQSRAKGEHRDTNTHNTQRRSREGNDGLGGRWQRIAWKSQGVGATRQGGGQEKQGGGERGRGQPAVSRCVRRVWRDSGGLAAPNLSGERRRLEVL